MKMAYLFSEMAINIFNEILKCLDALHSGENYLKEEDLEEGTSEEGNFVLNDKKLTWSKGKPGHVSSCF